MPKLAFKKGSNSRIQYTVRWMRKRISFPEFKQGISWPTAAKGDPKSPFSIATTLWCRGRCSTHS